MKIHVSTKRNLVTSYARRTLLRVTYGATYWDRRRFRWRRWTLFLDMYVITGSPQCPSDLMREHTHVVVISTEHASNICPNRHRHLYTPRCLRHVCLFIPLWSSANVYHKLREDVINTGEKEGALNSTLVGFSPIPTCKPSASHCGGPCSFTRQIMWKLW